MSNRRWLLLLLIFLFPGIPAPAAAGSPDLAGVTIDGSAIDLRATDGALIRLFFLADNVVRIQATTGEPPVGENSGRAPIVVWSDAAGVVARHEDHGDYRTFTTPAIELVVRRSPLTMELRRRRDGVTLWRELKPLTIGDSTTTQTLDSDPGERLYGGGQQNGAFQFKGRLMEVSYSGGWEEGDRPSPAPFYMSGRGYGVLRNTWTDGVYDFRSDNYLTATHNETRFDAYFMAGESIHEVLDLYTRLTGRARLLPRWAFEYGDADCYNDGDNEKKPGTVPDGWSDGPTGTTPDVVASVAAKYREFDMPGGWILPNDGYGCGYADLPDVVTQLRQLGFRTGLWTENGVEKIAWEVGTAGTRVQKLDVAWTGKGYQWAMDANHDAARGFLDNSDARPFIWTVMGWAGIQRYAVTWTGDQSGSWDYIRWHVPTLIGSGLSGMNYATGDVDGIFGGSPETFTRDLQWKAFTSVFMGMSGWSRAERKHPWWFEEPYRSINRRYLKLRQRLIPYIYTLARETETTGAPMVRGLMWDYPADPNENKYPYQFFLGRDLLVAPVYRSQAASGGWREGVYLPEGRWIDYWRGIVVDAGENGKVVDVPVDLATIPVLVRAGAIIPMYPESLYDGQVPADPLTLDIYPHGRSEYVLYEDDGNTRAYRGGAFSRQSFAVSRQGGTIDVTIGAAAGDFEGRLDRRTYVLQIHSRVAPENVAVNGEPLNRNPDRAGFESVDRGWYYDAEDRFGVAYVKTGRVDTGAECRIAVTVDPDAEPAVTGQYPPKPAGDGAVCPDALMVVSRAAEEPGHPLESAFDGNPDTWFRTVRDQRVAYGPHEFTLSLGGRRVIEGFRIRPRNDKYWKYGQVRDYELYLADVNGRWGDPIATGTLEQTDSLQEARFAPKAGRLLRFRVTSTHDDERDPMVTGAGATGGGPYNALAPVRVGPTTISEFRLLERPAPAGREITADLAEVAGGKQSPMVMNGLEFRHGISVAGDSRIDFDLSGDWYTLRFEAGIDDTSGDTGTARFQVWGDGSLLWDSGPVRVSQIVKPGLDIRGLSSLSLRTLTTPKAMKVNWAETAIAGFEGDTVRSVNSQKGR